MNQNTPDRIDCVWLPKDKNKYVIFILDIATFIVRGDDTDSFGMLGRHREWIDLSKRLECDLYFNEHTKIDEPITPYSKGCLGLDIKSRSWGNFWYYLKASCTEFTNEKFTFKCIEIGKKDWLLAQRLHSLNP